MANPTPPAKPGSTGWTADLLRDAMLEHRREYELRIDQRHEASDKAMERGLAAVQREIAAALAASEKATSKAEDAQRDMNISLSDRLDTSIKALADKVNALSLAVTRDEGRESGTSASTAAMWAVGAVLISTLTLAVELFKAFHVGGG